MLTKIAKQLEPESVLSGENIDWAVGENLAFTSLVKEGFKVRITEFKIQAAALSRIATQFCTTLKQQRVIMFFKPCKW